MCIVAESLDRLAQSMSFQSSRNVFCSASRLSSHSHTGTITLLLSDCRFPVLDILTCKSMYEANNQIFIQNINKLIECRIRNAICSHTGSTSVILFVVKFFFLLRTQMPTNKSSKTTQTIRLWFTPFTTTRIHYSSKSYS